MQKPLDFNFSNHKMDPQSRAQAVASYPGFLKNPKSAFHTLPERNSLWEASSELGQRLRKNNKFLVVIGIGGSSLGCKVIVDFAKGAGVLGSQNILFCESPDADEALDVWNQVQPHLSETSWIVISKSGGTLETLFCADFIIQKLKAAGQYSVSAFKVVTENKKSTLHDWAAKEGIETLDVPLDIGGRFSVLTPVGLVVASFAGYDLNEIRKGAQLALKSEESVFDMAAHIQSSWRNSSWISFFWFYSKHFTTFGFWLQQLWAESLAQKLTKDSKKSSRVSTPMIARGPADQHSLLQQLSDGEKDKWIIFSRVQSLETNRHCIQASVFENTVYKSHHSMGDILKTEAVCTEKALQQEGAPSSVMMLKDFTGESLGYSFMFWQMTVGLLGEMLQIDPYVQPGVELGKRLAHEELKN